MTRRRPGQREGFSLRGDPNGAGSRIPRMPMKALVAPSLAAIVVALIALILGQSPTVSSGGRSARVAVGTRASLTIANYAVAPAALTVRVGTTVTVKNTDSTAHTATARSGAFDSGTLGHNQSARVTLRKPGTYTFYCQFHAFMTGTIKVVR